MSRLFASITSEKPHSSITDWVEILSSDRYKENDYDGIPELVDAINLQAEGPSEASRAIRKKLKYGDVHRQLRALTLLRALVENCGSKFQSSFADDALITRIKALATNPLTDESVKRKLLSLLASWHRQFKDDAKMSTIANLWGSVGGGKPKRPVSSQPKFDYEEEARKRAEQKAKEQAAKEEEKRKMKERKEREKMKAKKKTTGTSKAQPFDFEKEKPLIVTSIANASQAAIDLTNALRLVNREQESIESNARVQACLANAKAARKTVIRYIQRVENEELIGTLLDTNERVITSLQFYDQLLKRADHDSDEDPKPISQSEPVSEISKLQGKQRAAIQRAASRSSMNVLTGDIGRSPPSGSGMHPDLKDLTWGTSIESENSALPEPLRPRAVDDPYDDTYRQGSLSDYSDYSSEEDDDRPSTSTAATSAAGHAQSGSRAYDNLIGDEEDLAPGDSKRGLLDPSEDPFADPFADSRSDFGTPVVEHKRL